MRFFSHFSQRLHVWWPAAIVIAVGTLLSVVLWRMLALQQTQTVQERLEQQSHLFAGSMEQSIRAYSDLVQMLRPLLQEVGLSAQDAFSAVKLTQEISLRYPGAETLSHVLRLNQHQYIDYREWFLNQVPSSERVDERLMPPVSSTEGDVYVIDEVWPQHAKRKLKGLDVHKLAQIQDLMQRLQVSNEPLMSQSFPLLHTSNGKTGVLMGIPLQLAAVTAGGIIDASAFLHLSINIERVVQHLLTHGMLSDIAVAIHDQGTADAPQSQLIFASEGWEAASRHALHTTHELSLGGRVWKLDFVPKASVLSGVEQYFPGIIAVSTLGASGLLALVVLLLTHQRSRAQLRVQAKHHLLRQRTKRFNALFHQSAIGVAEFDPVSGRYMSTNTRFVEAVGYSQQALETMSVYDLVHSDDEAECRRLLERLRKGKIPHFSVTCRIIRADAQVIWCECWVAPLQLNDGKPYERHIVLLQDVSERRLMQEQLQAREAYSSEMLRYMPVGLIVVGPLGDIEFVNHQFESMAGWSQHDFSDESAMWRLLCVDTQQHHALLEQLNAGRCEVVASGMNMPAMETLLRSKDGRELSMEVSGRFLGGRILLSFVDITQRKAAEAEIRWLGFYDTLTQLPNRRLLLDRLAEALQRSHRPHAGKGALLLLDLDNFKALNETLGHQLGDALLRLVATRLSHCISGQHTLARQGGDEFAVVLEDLPADPLEAGRCTEQVGCAILQALRAPFYLGGQDFHVTVSMGAVVFSGQADTVEELLKRADLALYQAKSAGRDTLQFFDPSMQQAVSARVEMEKDLRRALERHEFDLFFQAQIQGDRVAGAEALLRWNHPTKGFISPGNFVPAAEESGLILPLGEWVLFAACRQLALWAQDPVMAEMTMSVNVSPRQFYQVNFVEQVQQALEVTGARAEQLELELTEGMLLTDVDDTIEKMVQLKAMGVSFSLDDFGTGYSSLSYLKRLPLDKLKIDRGFVLDVVTDPNDAAITRSIIALGHSLGLKVIAEGVETQAQADFLAANGCYYWQGFHFSCPQPGPGFKAWVHAYTQNKEFLAQLV